MFIKTNNLRDFDTLATLMQLYYDLLEVWEDPNDTQIIDMRIRLSDAIFDLSGCTPGQLCKSVS
jgi:hypothetical protein